MYCIYCGKPIPENGKCNCKDPVVSLKKENPYEPTPVISPYTPPEYTQNIPVAPPYAAPINQPYATQSPVPNDDYSNAIRAAFGSGTMLVVAILSCIAFVLDIISFNINIPLLLIIIASFMINSNARNKRSRLSQSGYTLFSISTIITLATNSVISVSILIYVIRLILTDFMNDKITCIAKLMNDDFKHATIRLTPLANVSLCLIIFAIALLMFLYLLTLNNNLLFIRRKISAKNDKGRFSSFPNIMLIIHGGLGIIASIVFFKEQVLITNILHELLIDFHTVYEVLSVTMKFGLPATLMIMSIANIFTGITFCNFGKKIKNK